MTRRIVYGMGLWATAAGLWAPKLSEESEIADDAAVTAMTLASIIMPRWIRWNNVCSTLPLAAKQF
jgi:hypothetical protein